MDSDAPAAVTPTADILHALTLELSDPAGAGLLNAVPDPLVVIDPPDRVVACNLEAERLLGIPRARWGTFSLVEGGPPAYSRGEVQTALPPARWLEADRSHPLHFEGDERWFSPHWSVVRGSRWRTLVLRDVGARVAEEERLEAMRREFLSAAAHKFSTPLTAIKMYVHLLKAQESRSAEASERSQQLKVLDQHLNRLSAEISEVVDLAQLQLGPLPMSPQPAELLGLVRRVIEQFSIQRSERRIRFDPAEAYLIGTWDELRIAQVLRQLIDNADRYSSPEHPIEVWAQSGGDAVRLEVRDFGMGMPSEVRAHLFEPYFRGESVTGQRLGAGLGMGLYLSRAIIEQHGGTIDIESEPGRGTRVIVVLPRVPPGR